MAKVNAVILAGRQGKSSLDAMGNKALLKIGNKMMIQYIIEALRASGKVDKIAAVGPQQELTAAISDKVDFIINGEDLVTANALKGVEFFKDKKKVLIVTSDIPLLTPKAIIDFINKSEATGADLCYPLVTQECCQQKYPDAKRTFTTIKDGTFTGGNAFYINPAVARKCYDLFNQIIENRKNVFQMAKYLGPRIILGLLLKTLRLSDVEKRLHKLIGIHARALISEYPEIGNDVDKPEDVLMATKYLVD